MNDKLAIIGGTGVYDPKILEQVKEISIETEYGKLTVLHGLFAGREAFFLNRHGAGHTVPPHLVNYRAIVRGLYDLGVRRVIATTAVGAINAQLQPGTFVFPDSYLDFTKTRKTTFFEGSAFGTSVVHTDMSEPYCPALRRTLSTAAGELGLNYVNGGVYVTTEGPRFETAAEIKMFAMLGGDVVGMTSFPEVALARELKMCYATVSMVTNMAAGISPTHLTHQEVLDVMADNADNFRALLARTVPALDNDRVCKCQA